MEFNTPQYEAEPKTKSIGALIGVFIILILIIVGGLYFWGKKMNTDKIEKATLETTKTEAVAELDSIEADLNNIDKDTTVTETMKAIDTDLK